MTLSPEQRIKELLPLIRNKRARVVIEHILEHGYITTEQLEKDYGYNHPPRAARDVREVGIPLETFRVKSSDGRSIAAYRFGDLNTIRKGRLQGRSAIPKQFKKQLYELTFGKCSICSGDFEERYLQVDHRIPYEVSGVTNSGSWNIEDYMLLCGSCNRAKSWSCEHCENWIHEKFPQVCQSCYWANPENYFHIALKEVRRIDILWSEEEVQTYEKLKEKAQKSQHRLSEYVKMIVRKHLGEV